MASVPSIPPLFCSTPPPIEFCENDDDSGLSPTLTLEDEEDVFGEYTSRTEGLTPDVTSLPRTPLQNELSSSTTSGFTEVPPTIFDDNLTTTTTKEEDHVVEAFNYTIDSQYVAQDAETLAKAKEQLADDTPICKVDKRNPDAVILEDILDDSDNELYSPSKDMFDVTLDENSKEFYEIHVITENESYKTPKSVDIDSKKEKEIPTIPQQQKVEEELQDNLKSNIQEDDDDFAEFSTFERAVEPVNEVTNFKENETSEFMFEADFSAFSTQLNDKADKTDSNIAQTFKNLEPVEPTKNVEEFVVHDENDDDDFGDFEEAVVPAVECTQSLPTLNLSNLNERLNCILHNIFPLDADVDVERDAAKESLFLQDLYAHQKLELPPIDAAKALGYQWAGSQMRNALIKSIGVDRRNIMFGDNWNTSMPRFAANLSGSPLQPLKPESVCQQANSDNVLGKQMNEVPAVEFDWNTAGLVNPLDASQVHTLLLDLDQLVVVANVDYINVDSSSCCSTSACATSTQQTDTTTTNITAMDYTTFFDQLFEMNSTTTTTTTTTDVTTMGTCNNDLNSSSHGISSQMNLLAFDEIVEIPNSMHNFDLILNDAFGASLDPNNTLTTTTTTSLNNFNNFINGAFHNHHIHALGNNKNQTNNIPLDCRSKEVLQSRETETHTTLQQPDDIGSEHEQQQQQQQPQQQQEEVELHIDTAANDNSEQQQPQQWESEQTQNGTNTTTTTNLSVLNIEKVAVEVEDEVVTTFTYAGPLKETHIYTPPRGSETSLPRTLRAGYMTTPNTPLRSDPIDFDYEKAAAGIIIDETVVKKEYRDVEYNPDFSATANNICDDDFTEFQSVPPPPIPANISKPYSILNSPVLQAKNKAINNTSRTVTPTFAHEMILSPAILLPQAVSMNNNENNLKPKIEWGDTASSINPEELARIEELFSQSKSPTTTTTNSQKSTPNHQVVRNSPLTISAAIAHKEQTSLDDDEWSDFVSVTPATKTFPKIRQQPQNIMNSNNNNNNIDDDWSDFVSNTTSSSSSSSTSTQHHVRAHTQLHTVAQFNSGAWKNANFYNNPLSFYHQSQPQPQQQKQQTPAVPSMHKVQNNDSNNNFNSINNNNFLPQQIHIMQDFSTAPPNMQQYQRQAQQQQQSNSINNNNNNQYQVGTAKVAPSISLIPDLGFVAPAMPTHTAYVNALPKSTFSMKK